MGWGSTRNRRMPYLAGYAQAQAHWESIKPKRGSNEHADRPLHDRSDRNRWVRKYGDTYSAVLYNTEAVTYNPDGTVCLYSGGWATHATADFMMAIAPVTVLRFDDRLWAHMDGKYYVIANTLTIKKDAEGRWQPVNPQTTLCYRRNKDKCKAVRTSFKPFVAYADAMFKLGGIAQPRWGGWGASNKNFDLNDESTYYELFMGLRGQDIKTFRKHLWAWAYQRYECYETIAVPLGELVETHKRY